jgi:hypothetical protein
VLITEDSWLIADEWQAVLGKRQLMAALRE